LDALLKLLKLIFSLQDLDLLVLPLVALVLVK